jgi:hypothetical protein
MFQELLSLCLSTFSKSLHHLYISFNGTRPTELMHNYLLMELSPSWEAANCAATHELPSILWNPKVHCRVHKSPQLVPILSQIDPVHTIPSYLRSILILYTHPCLDLPIHLHSIVLNYLSIGTTLYRKYIHTSQRSHRQNWGTCMGNKLCMPVCQRSLPPVSLATFCIVKH